MEAIAGHYLRVNLAVGQSLKPAALPEKVMLFLTAGRSNRWEKCSIDRKSVV